MGKILITAAYAAYAAFWIRFFMHALVWWRATPSELPATGSKLKVWAFTALDIVFLGRMFMVNPTLWLGEWVFHASFFLVLLRHLRYFLNPVPSWVWAVQTPGLIAGYIMPFSLIYILVIRLLTRREKYASRANMLLLGLILVISLIGVLMHSLFKPDLVGVKMFILGIMALAPVSAPESILFSLHFILVLVLVVLLPTHIVTAPFVMWEARKREQALHGVMHEPGEQKNL
jgi:nitrate reductase gamma subunit